MKKALIGIGAIAVLIGTPAFAADLDFKAPPPAIYDWTGFYIGANVGWESADTDGYTNSTCNNFGVCVPGVGIPVGLSDNTPTSQTMRGWLGGAQFGYNYQFRRVVVGFEVSGSWAGVSSQSTGSFTGPIAVNQIPLGCSQLVEVNTAFVNVATVSCNVKQDWNAQALTKLGYAFGDGRFLPYITGGIALTHINVSTTNSVAFGTTEFAQDSFGANRVMYGGSLGAGAQYALGHGFSVGVEYLYTFYPSEDLSNIGRCSITGPNVALCGVLGAGGPLSHTVHESNDLATNTVRVMLNYKFGE